MSEALDVYLSVGASLLVDDSERKDAAYRSLCRAADVWRSANKHLSAAFAMEVAIAAGWGVAGRVDEAVRACIEDCRRCVEHAPLDSIEALAALQIWRSHLVRYYEASARRMLAEALNRELAERLTVVFADTPEAVGYLVRGVQLVGHLDGEWRADVPPYAHRTGGSSRGGDGSLMLHLPSAFRVLRQLGDFETLQSLIDRFPSEFDAVALKGWKWAVAGELDPEHRAELFSVAAEAFFEDRPPTPEEMNLVTSWTNENFDVWSKFFRARSALARITHAPSEAPQFVEEAVVALEGTESGTVVDEVYRLGIVVRSLAALIGRHSTTALEDAVRDLNTAKWLFGDDATDTTRRSFIDQATEMLAVFESDPASAIASDRLARALETLARLPSIGADVAQAVGPAAGEHALAIVRGLDLTWVHRVLAGIEDERQLQRVFLRIAQGALPRYAQIRHGPQEYGKDVAVLIVEAGRNVLRMYQMKCGDIGLPGWRAVKNQLEEMFTVPLTTMNLNEVVDERIGVLVCNGHALPAADPPMVGWFEQELRDRNRRYEFMHLDTLASWIIDGRLYGCFRAALKEVGISLV